MIRTAIVIVGLLFALVNGLASARDVSDASELVQKLGDSSFHVREKADSRLRELGPVALPALKEAFEHEDLEIRYRARRLYEVVLHQDHLQRLERFRTEKDGKNDFGLPGWKRFGKLIGTDLQARSLFCNMQRSEAKLFRVAEQGGKPFEEYFQSRCAEILSEYQTGGSRRAVPSDTLCALLFTGSDPECNIDDRTASYVTNFASNTTFIKNLNEGAQQGPIRRVFGQWILKPSGSTAYQKMNLAVQHRLKEGVAPALELVRSNVAGHTFQYAVFAVAQLGSEQHIPELEKLLSNKTTIYPSNAVLNRTPKSPTTFTCQIRDVALIGLLHLTKQDHRAYGFTKARAHSRYLFSPNSVGFAGEKPRAAALSQWEQWRKKHRPEKPADDNPQQSGSDALGSAQNNQ